MTWPDWVPGRMSMSAGPSRLSTDSVAPSAAATIGIVTVQWRSSPCRSKMACGRCTISRNRSPGGPPPAPDLAPAGQREVRAVLAARRDPDLDRPPGPHPAVAVALRAGTDQHGAVSAASRADPGHHHLADERAGDLAHLAATAADVTGLRVGARRGALTGAGGADHGRVHRQLPGGAERALGEVQLDPDRGVGAARRAPPRPGGRGAPRRAEELVEQVVQRV